MRSCEIRIGGKEKYSKKCDRVHVKPNATHESNQISNVSGKMNHRVDSKNQIKEKIGIHVQLREAM